MFGKQNNTGTKTLIGGLLMTIFQTMISRRIAGRAAGVAVRGGGGIPGLLIWLLVSYLFNKYMGRNSQQRGPAPAQNNPRFASASR